MHPAAAGAFCGFIGGYWTSPLCSLDRRYDSSSTCSALPPVSRLSFVLGEFSFWLGFGRCPGAAGALTVALTATVSLREFYPLCLVLPLRGSDTYLAFVPQLGACRSRSLIPSLAPSWWCPCPLMWWALLTLSGYVLCVPSAFSLRWSRWSIPSHCRPSRAVCLLTVSIFGGR